APCVRWPFVCIRKRHVVPLANALKTRLLTQELQRPSSLCTATFSPSPQCLPRRLRRRRRGGGSTPPPPPITVTITPNSGTVLLGNTLSFSASVTNSSDTSVVWSVNAVPGGS